mgnify:CR=1 FL=1
MGEALGMIETRGLVAMIEASDKAGPYASLGMGLHGILGAVAIPLAAQFFRPL